jgi:NADH:ubiquinone oxidoreductase subunit C
MEKLLNFSKPQGAKVESTKELEKSLHFSRMIVACMPQWITSCKVKKRYLSFTVKPEGFHSVIKFLKEHSTTQVSQLADLCVVDYPARENRLEVVANLTSTTTNSRVIVRTQVDEFTPVDSLSDLYSSAVWWEREAWDLYGVFFQGNDDLRCLLTDYGHTTHPLRKDFPLSGYAEVRYDDSLKRVVYEPVELPQAHRNWSFGKVWDAIAKKSPELT